MNINHKKIARSFITIFVILIVGFSTFNSVIQVHNTEDPYYARKVALKTMMIIFTSIIAGGVALYSLRDQKKL